ncbi:DUF4238 domain-containing protein [Sphingobacterium sp. MYb388]|uniref:DUF4238 domain-containing protein n=1 Tax=Sphingobacterium sp. MYb388 TaxID=2745437 RepID=UPI003098B485
MATNITKKQHYVWRNYLRAWAKDEQITTYLKNQQKIILTDLMNVAQQRYFNKFNKLTEIDKKFLNHMVSEVKGPIKSMLDDLLYDINLFNDLKEIQEQITDATPEPLEELEKNGFELLHTIIEEHGQKIIQCRSYSDLLFLEDPMSKFETLMFICFQYFRTKKQRDIQIENFKDTSLNIKNINSILSVISAARVAQNISFDPKIRFCLLEILNDEITFITSDQPVINLHGNEKDNDGYTQDLSFYYPISPKHALIIDFSDSGDRYQYKCINQYEAVALNGKIASEYHEFLFADSETELMNANS